MKKNLLISFLYLIFQFGYFSSNAQWQQTNGPEGGNINCMVTNETSIFAGVMGGGVVRSTDNGQSWSSVNNGLIVTFSDGSERYLNVTALAINGNDIFAATWEEGVYLSKDNGQNWSPANKGLTTTYIYSLIVNGANIFAGTSGGGIFFSSNNGQSWSAVNTGLTSYNIRSLAAIGDNIFAGTIGGGIFLSTNNGQSWSEVNTGLTNKKIYSLTISGNIIFAGTWGSGIFFSTDNGQSWSAVNTGLTSYYIFSLAAIGDNIFAGTYGGGIFLSTNNGQSWSGVNVGLTNKNIYSLTVSGNNIFTGTEGSGIFVSTNNGQSWSLANKGIVNTDVRSISFNGGYIFVGTLGGGIFRSANNGQSWLPINSGLTTTEINSLFVNGNNIFAGTDGGGIFISSNNGQSWSAINTGLTNYRISSFINIDNNIFVGTYGGGIFLSTSNGQSWSAVNTGLTTYNINSLAVNGDNIFAGTIGGGVFLSSNKGQSWSAVNTGLTTLDVRSIVINKNNIFAGTFGGGIFRSSNNGQSWSAAGLSGNSIMTLSFIENNIFAGTWFESKVFLSTNEGQSWTEVDPGLKNTLGIGSLAIYGNNIIAGTSYNGVWKRPLSDMLSLKVTYPNLTLNTSSINAGQSIAISGKDFKLSGKVNITINGPDGFSQSVNNISTNGLGGFNYSFVTTIAMPTGIYSINASDNTSGLSAPVKQFTLKSTSVQTNNLTITSPLQSIAVDVDEKFLIEWKDKMVQGKSYTISGSKRNYKYTIELSDDNGSNWKTLKTVEGQEYINGWAYLNFSTSIATPGSEYVIRIIDFYNSTNSQTTSVITVNQATQTKNIKADLNWDFSFPQPSSQLEGVAAEGTARIFLNLSKINSTSGPDISSVKVTLTDDFNGSDPAKLGKIKVATQTSTYSPEANGTVAITATDNTAKKDNYIFWYVAPDDFAGADPKDLKSSSRIVTATFTVYYANGTTEILTKPIRIVRPPLMLVHGLASDASTWDNFRHNELGYELKFTEDFRFKTCMAVNILPDASYKRNAENMTILNNPNSFQGVINDIRNKGYAANQVDYVCHSMGGCVLRSIYDNYYAYFTKTGIASNSHYKNYEKGYVNKVIMIGTPNNSSPWADIVNRYAGDLPFAARVAIQSWYGFSGNDKPLPLMYMQAEDLNKLVPTYKASDAVKDLQIDDNQGGVNFGVTNTKAHLIAGDFFPGAQLNTNGIIPQEVINNVKNTGDEKLQDLLLWFLKIASKKEPDPILHQKLLDILESKVEPIEKALAFLDKMAMVMDAFNVGTFIPESDLVVSVGSQLAGYSKPASNGVSNVSAFDNFVGHAFFRAETKNMDIGNRVNYLLNSNINSPLFDIIPATPAQTKLKSSQNNLVNTIIISKTDTNKLQIIHPQNNSTAYVDSSFHVQFNIKDTTNLKSVELMFQNKTYHVDSLLIGTVDMNLQLNSNLLNNQRIILEGYYLFPDSAEFVYDQINVNIITNDTLKGFGIDPKILYLFKNQIKQPEYYGIYKNSVTSGNFSSNITAIVNDTSFVKFDFTSKGFKGIAPGETFAKISYEGFSDTLYFVVNETDIDYVQHFSPVWTGNGVDHMYLDIYSAKLDGVELETGDEIGIFDGNICVGVGTLTGIVSQTNTLDIAVSRNDGSWNGYTPGNTITFKLYDADKNLEVNNVSAQYSDEDPSWITDGKYKIGTTAFAALTGATKINQDIVLNTGWNIISTRVRPTNLEMKDIFQPLIDAGKLKKVMDESGKTIENFGAFGGWKNNIGNLKITKGYKVNVTATSILSLEGTPVQLPLDISMNTGWNIISYPSTAIQDAKALVQLLIDAGKLKKVMDETGKTIENFGAFGGWKNNIGNFTPGKGYKVNVTENCILTVPASGTKSAVVVPELLASEHFKPVFSGNGTDHMNIHLVDLLNGKLKAGDEIGIFDDKRCVGSAQIGPDQMLSDCIGIPASCNDELDEPNGFTPGNALTMRLFRNNQEYLLNPELIFNSKCIFVKGESLFARVNAEIETGLNELTESVSVKCYPNPFSDQITIEIEMLKAQKLNVKIYDASGRLIRYLYQGKTIKGITLIWDGKNDQSVKMASGSYFLKANDTVKKIVLKH